MVGTRANATSDARGGRMFFEYESNGACTMRDVTGGSYLQVKVGFSGRGFGDGSGAQERGAFRPRRRNGLPDDGKRANTEVINGHG